MVFRVGPRGRVSEGRVACVEALMHVYSWGNDVWCLRWHADRQGLYPWFIPVVRAVRRRVIRKRKLQVREDAGTMLVIRFGVAVQGPAEVPRTAVGRTVLLDPRLQIPAAGGRVGVERLVLGFQC